MNYLADSSFLISLFVDDEHSQKALKTFDKLKTKQEKVYIPLPAIIELVYVLEKLYKLRRRQVAKYIYAVLNTYIFIVEKRDLIYDAMASYRKYGSISFADSLIAAEAKAKKIIKILSFDAHFKVL